MPPTRASEGGVSKPEVLSGGDDLSIVEKSDSKKIIEGALKKYYEPMEVWYLRSSIDKVRFIFPFLSASLIAHSAFFPSRPPQALRLDTPDTSSRPHLSSAPDDTFYLLKLVLYRLVASSSLPTLDRMVANISEIMERDFIGGIKRKMDGVYAGVRSAGAQNATSGGAGGSVKGVEAERMEREMRGTFVVSLSSLLHTIRHLGVDV